MLQTRLFSRMPQDPANASLHVKFMPDEKEYSLEVQIVALRPHGAPALTREDHAAIMAAGVPLPGAASTPSLLSLSTEFLDAAAELPPTLTLSCVDIFNPRPERWLADRLTSAREVPCRGFDERCVKRCVKHYNQAEMCSSISEGPIRNGDLLFSVKLDTTTQLDFNATCDNWCLPAPWLKPSLGKQTPASRAQLKGEGATVRVSGNNRCNMNINTMRLPEALRAEIMGVVRQL